MQQIEIFLDEQLKHLEKAKSDGQSQDTLQVEETKNKNENVVEKKGTRKINKLYKVRLATI
ncbi:hypothetical protein wTpre_671 [Wolbachia endosymbiont of Trichogramma pretiosum]|nr:hypothetical protein wTpre_671 [Wolbachia endosymbiont of Trichogramma pretiosum]